jgi:hypothetical protein
MHANEQSAVAGAVRQQELDVIGTAFTDTFGGAKAKGLNKCCYAA